MSSEKTDGSEKDDDDKASVVGSSGMDFIFLDEEEVETAAVTIESTEYESSTVEPLSPFVKVNQSVPESCSPGKVEKTTKRLITKSSRKRKIENAARRDHENRNGYGTNRHLDVSTDAFLEDVWTVVQCNVTQSMLKAGLNRPLTEEILEKFDIGEGRMSEFFIDSATEESESNSLQNDASRKQRQNIVPD